MLIPMSELDLLSFCWQVHSHLMNLLLVLPTAPAESECIGFADLSDWAMVNLAEWQTLTISLYGAGII